MPPVGDEHGERKQDQRDVAYELGVLASSMSGMATTQADMREEMKTGLSGIHKRIDNLDNRHQTDDREVRQQIADVKTGQAVGKFKMALIGAVVTLVATGALWTITRLTVSALTGD